ncbi:MAG TPA: hypothetical protein PKM72_12450 [Nitrospirales bacterium]|nr:hypothetical protein [Nitrospirales bacterium]
MMELDVWNNWMSMALLTPALWAVSCIIDVCFVGERIFRFPSDGPIISGLFCVLPFFVLATEVGGWEPVTLRTSWPALLAGACYFLHLYFVFRALFTMNDASCSETFNTLSVLFVPVMAFVLLGERLDPIYYFAIVLALGGIFVLIRYHLSGVHRHAVVLLTVAVLCISLTMVLQAWVFEQMGYWNGVVLFSLGTFLTALIVGGVQRRRRQRILGLCWRFGGIFLVAELLQLAAVLASQRATAIGPSVSIVAVVECSLPLFVMVFSAGLLLSRYRKSLSPAICDTLRLQMTSSPVKLTSVTLILIAILIVQITVI